MVILSRSAVNFCNKPSIRALRLRGLGAGAGSGNGAAGDLGRCCGCGPAAAGAVFRSELSGAAPGLCGPGGAWPRAAAVGAAPAPPRPPSAALPDPLPVLPPAPAHFPLSFPLAPGAPGPSGAAARRGRSWAGCGAMIAVSIPAAEAQAAARSPDRAHTVFRVEVLCNGRRHTVAKRYSEFQALHKRIKKTCKVPDFPPRHVPNWMPKVLEQRRQGLELYIRGVLYHNEELPQDVLDFLKLRCCQQDPKASSSLASRPPSQRPVVGFCTDPYAQPPGTQPLPDTILSGVLQGLYLPRRSTHAAPRAAASPLQE
ncbi:sorting nexin-22 isoform X4 [Lathamus discolor]|uniref:sorting nexin-22 isoform X4 n=1 Tax=Lathamus discolor TaxID=678569 RepID=UPI0032B7C41E